MIVVLNRPIQPAGLGRPLERFDSAEFNLDIEDRGVLLQLLASELVLIPWPMVAYIQGWQAPAAQIQESSPSSPPSKRRPIAAASRST